jgi:CHAD domain-containing protein
MKTAIELRFAAVENVAQAQQHIVRVRFAEALARQGALDGADDDALHAFRLACKRLRFAIERLHPRPPDVERSQTLLARLTDELGGAHDCAELAKLAVKSDAPLVAARARRDRDRYVTRARALWRHAFESSGDFAALARYAEFSWSRS